MYDNGLLKYYREKAAKNGYFNLEEINAKKRWNYKPKS